MVTLFPFRAGLNRSRFVEGAGQWRFPLAADAATKSTPWESLMITFRKTLNVPLAALLVSGLCLAGCEKAANGGPTPAAEDNGDTVRRSTVPDLPSLNKPFFSPDLVDRVGGVDLFAIAESKLALTQSHNPNVKTFATAAIDTHNKSLSGLGAAIDSSGQTISYPDAMPNDLAGRLATLQKAAGASFDKAYIADQIEAQQAVVSALQTFSKHGDVVQFKTFALNSEPAARNILASAQTLQSSLK
jgi:predicted outer membrane protein